MPQILDPTNTADDTAFDGIRDLAHTTATSAEIAANPLFLAAEDYILGRLSEASDRNYARRDKVVLALQFLTAANFIEGGGETSASSSGSQQTSGVVSSRSVGAYREEYVDSTRTIRSNVDITALNIKDRIKYLKDTAIGLIDDLVGQPSSTSDLPSPMALTTRSKLNA